MAPTKNRIGRFDVYERAMADDTVTTTRVGTEITYQLADDHVGHLVRDAMHHALQEEGQ